MPEHINLKIVDGRIPENGLVPRLIRKYRLENRVTIVKEMLERDELVRQYARGRAAIVPSFFEGFGFPASEAMACGLPVIANAAGALPEVVGTDGRTGRLVPPRDAQAMAQAARDILFEPGKAEAMGEAARRRVQNIFRWEDAAANLVNVFKDTIRASNSRSRAA